MVGVRYRRALFPGFSDKAEFSFPCPSTMLQSREQRPEQDFQFEFNDDNISELNVTARLLYRKIDQFLLNFLMGEDSGITAPITVISETSKSIKVVSGAN